MARNKFKCTKITVTHLKKADRSDQEIPVGLRIRFLCKINDGDYSSPCLVMVFDKLDDGEIISWKKTDDNNAFENEEMDKPYNMPSLYDEKLRPVYSQIGRDIYNEIKERGLFDMKPVSQEAIDAMMEHSIQPPPKKLKVERNYLKLYLERDKMILEFDGDLKSGETGYICEKLSYYNMFYYGGRATKYRHYIFPLRDFKNPETPGTQIKVPHTLVTRKRNGTYPSTNFDSIYWLMNTMGLADRIVFNTRIKEELRDYISISFCSSKPIDFESFKKYCNGRNNFFAYEWWLYDNVCCDSCFYDDLEEE